MTDDAALDLIRQQLAKDRARDPGTLYASELYFLALIQERLGWLAGDIACDDKQFPSRSDYHAVLIGHAVRLGALIVVMIQSETFTRERLLREEGKDKP